MLHEGNSEVRASFQEGQEADYFDNYEELQAKIRFYLEHDDLRQRIAWAGYERVTTGGHSYVDRARVILQEFNALSGAKSR